MAGVPLCYCLLRTLCLSWRRDNKGEEYPGKGGENYPAAQYDSRLCGLTMLISSPECMNSDLLEELMSSEVFAPLLRLSPPPGDHDYIYNLDESEGVCDLFDVPVLNL